MKQFFKFLGFAALGLVGLVILFNVDFNAIPGYVVFGVLIGWIAIDHTNTKIAFLNSEIAELRRRLAEIEPWAREQKFKQELEKTSFYTVRPER